MRQICLMLTIKTPERYQWLHSGVFTVKFEQISQISIADFEQVNTSWYGKDLLKADKQ